MSAQSRSLRHAALAALFTAALGAQPGFAAPAYILSKTVPLGAPDRWDYVIFDPATQRVYVAHADHLAVIDPAAGRLVGEVQDIPGGTHGTAISVATGQGFTDDGRNGQVVVFDLKSLDATRRIPADQDADAIAIERSTGHVFVIEGDPGAITVIDPTADTPVASINVGEKMEYATADDRGTVFVAGAEKRDLLRVDARTNTVTARWPTPDCAIPHGLALDRERRRLFMGCVNQKLMVVDADTGQVVAELSIGRGSDAIAYDPVRRRVFSSNGVDGTISVFQQTGSDGYVALDLISTQVSGRTMAVDPRTGELFVAAVQTDPSPTPGARPRPRPGTLALLVFRPVK